MSRLNWRREALFLSIAGMETCWIVGWSRAILGSSDSTRGGLAWWSVWLLYLIALATARTLSRLKLRASLWIVGGLALLTALIQANLNAQAGWLDLAWLPGLLSRQADPTAARGFVALLLGLGVWFQASRVFACFGDTRATVRRFQTGVLVWVALVLFTLRFPAPVNDLVVAYFGWGLLVMALTRIEEVAEVDPGAAGSFGRKWMLTLAATLFAVGGLALLLSRVITVRTLRWLLTPLAILAQIVIFALVVLFTALASQILPLLKYLLGDRLTDSFRKNLENLGENVREIRPGQIPESGPSTQLAQALQIVFVVGLMLVVVWLLVRSFRQWRMRQYATPGGVRETVESEGTLAQDLLSYWRHLKETAGSRRLFRRHGIESAQAIYASLLAWLAAANHPRQPEQTPYEYQPVAEKALPTCWSQLQAITEAYVRAHYGEAEIDGEELTRLQEAWAHIKSDQAGGR